MSLQQILDQEKFRNLSRTYPRDLSSLSHPKVLPIDFNKKGEFRRCSRDLPFYLRFSQVGYLETLLTPDWGTSLDTYDPFTEEEEPLKIQGFYWKYYGWAEVSSKTVCGNGSVYVPSHSIHDNLVKGSHMPRHLSE